LHCRFFSLFKPQAQAQLKLGFHLTLDIASATALTEQCLKGTEVMKLSEKEQDELAQVVLRLIREDRDIQAAVVDLVCSCPNVVMQF